MGSQELDIEEAWGAIRSVLIRSLGFGDSDVTPVPKLRDASGYKLLSVFKKQDATLAHKVLGHDPEISYRGQVEDIIGDNLDVDVIDRNICLERNLRLARSETGQRKEIFISIKKCHQLEVKHLDSDCISAYKRSFKKESKKFLVMSSIMVESLELRVSIGNRKVAVQLQEPTPVAFVAHRVRIRKPGDGAYSALIRRLRRRKTRPEEVVGAPVVAPRPSVRQPTDPLPDLPYNHYSEPPTKYIDQESENISLLDTGDFLYDLIEDPKSPIPSEKSLQADDEASQMTRYTESKEIQADGNYSMAKSFEVTPDAGADPETETETTESEENMYYNILGRLPMYHRMSETFDLSYVTFDPKDKVTHL
ncbi:hypothetical protein CAPTEDRAFT_185902 [Capitella teleta]|uniref:Uncharacterized protein n=1 Tax=Capitella teleta TaxID=283909 RepID=R7TKR6_CAPTE|nr:hypothetical protein CAPTEDRAFT_185902 [Capitella teleta]|eukprot:ELT91700.1 hypothetical protein CAPTEDRAFT_185902 [Capitella teleta]